MSNLDLSYLKSVTDGDKELIKELIEIFKNQVPEYLQDFQDAYQQKDAKTLSQIAHKSKSSVAIMGMNRLAADLEKFEKEAREGQFSEQYINYIENFDKQCQDALMQLEILI